MNEKNAASEPGERSCLSRTGVISRLRSANTVDVLTVDPNCDGKYFYPIG